MMSFRTSYRLKASVQSFDCLAAMDAEAGEHLTAQEDSGRKVFLERRLSCTQPYLELPPTPLTPVGTPGAREPVAILRSLMVGQVPHVECFQETSTVTLGRLDEESTSEHVRVRVNDKRISSDHCRICRSDPVQQGSPSPVPQFSIQDMSSNGTYLNGKRLEKGVRVPLQSGDEISLVVNSQRKHFGMRSQLLCAFVMRVLGVERSTVLKDAGSMLEEKYNLLSRVLGSGAFSQVLLCTSKFTGQVMALKAVDKRKFTKFRRSSQTQLTPQSEREVMESIDHPNIVKLYETFDTPHCLYLVMEFCAGGDLLQRILDHGIHTAEVTRRLFKEVLSGLEWMHRRNIAHRDIKPENILLTSAGDDGTAKIADLGVAKFVDDEYARMHMQRATLCGTPHYFAPETVMIAEGGVTACGTAVDMWAAGVVLYIMLCGFPPFEDDCLYDQIASGTYAFDAEQWRSVSSLAQDLVQKLMHVQAAERLTAAESLKHPWILPALDADPTAGDKGAAPAVKRRRTSDGVADMSIVDMVHHHLIPTPQR